MTRVCIVPLRGYAGDKQESLMRLLKPSGFLLKFSFYKKNTKRYHSVIYEILIILFLIMQTILRTVLTITINRLASIGGIKSNSGLTGV